MNPDDAPSPRRPIAARRPPRPTGPPATVIRLGHAPAQPADAVQGTLALDLLGSSGMPEQPSLTLVRGEPEPLLRPWAGRFAQAVVEVLGGDRPVTQLVRWTTPPVYADVSRRVSRLTASTAAATRARQARPQVASVRLFRPAATAAEMSVHVRHGDRSRAIAARLERIRDRWQCTALQLG